MKENRGRSWNDIENFNPTSALVWIVGIGFPFWLLVKIFG